MARPLKRGLDYFPLNVDFFDQEEIFCLGAELGPKAEFVALRLLSAIYRNGYYLEWNAMSRGALARKMELTGEFLDRVVSRLVELGFFDAGLFASDSVLTSKQIQEVFFEVTKRRRINKPQEFPYLLLLLTKTPVNVDNNSQSKVKESKVKESKHYHHDDDNDDEKDRREQKLAPTPPSPSPIEKKLSDEEKLTMMLEQAAADEGWVCEMAAFLNLGGPAAARELLRGDFRRHCLREGKAHRNIPDLKSHFNRWAPLQLNTSKSNNNNHSQISPLTQQIYGKNHPLRPASSYESKLPITPACGLKRRPNPAL